jgi:hypothetical protein
MAQTTGKLRLMKKRLILHIGQPKSATTSIQAFLKNNRKALLQQGYLYPESGLQHLAHHCLGNFFVGSPVDWIKPRNPDKVKVALMAEVEQAACHTVVMSTESLFYPAVDPARLHLYFSEFEITIFMTLRRQDEWLESALRDNIKTGHVNGNDHMARTKTLLPSVDYEFQINKWAAEFGEDAILLSTFEPGGNREPVEQDFLKCIGADFDPEMVVEPTHNDRLNRDCLEFLSLMRTKRRIAARHFSYFKILAEYSKQHKDPEEYRYILPPKIRLKVMADNAEKNARIARKFLNRKDGTLFRFGPTQEGRPWAEYPGITSAAAVLIGEYLADKLFEASGRL